MDGLDQIITVNRPTSGTDDEGTPVGGLTAVGVCRGQVRTTGQTVSDASGAQAAVDTTSATLDPVTALPLGIRVGDRLSVTDSLGPATFDVQGIRDTGLTLRCTLIRTVT